MNAIEPCGFSREPRKRQHVQQWLTEVVNEHEDVISTKVLIELRSVASRKLQPPLGITQTHDLLEALSGFEVISTDDNLVLDANHLAITENLSWFDALIADIGHSRAIQDLQVINPFLEINPPSSGAAV